MCYVPRGTCGGSLPVDSAFGAPNRLEMREMRDSHLFGKCGTEMRDSHLFLGNAVKCGEMRDGEMRDSHLFMRSGKRSKWRGGTQRR